MKHEIDFAVYLVNLNNSKMNFKKDIILIK